MVFTKKELLIDRDGYHKCTLYNSVSANEVNAHKYMVQAVWVLNESINY